MAWYIFMLFAILAAGAYRNKSIRIYGKREISIDFSLLIASGVLLFFAAFRAYTVGADTRQQQIIFELCSKENWSNLISSTAYKEWFYLESVEVGYKYYCKFLSLFGSSKQIITIANSFMLIIPLVSLIKKESINPWLSIYLFFTLGFFQTSLNLTPSAIASLIAMNGFRYIYEKKFGRYLLYILLASIFHYSAFIFIVLYFIKDFKITKKRFWIILGIFLVWTVLFYDITVQFLTVIVPEKYLMYLQSKVLVEQILVYLVQFIAILLCMHWRKKDKNFYSEHNFEIILFLIESILYFFALKSKGFSRIAFLFSPYLIISIPNMIYGKKQELKKQRKGFNFGYKELLIVLYGLAAYLARSAVNNIGTTVPYKFF